MFLLWGKDAKEKASVIVGNGEHKILCADHPYPICSKDLKQRKHFSETNRYLAPHDKCPIKWVGVFTADKERNTIRRTNLSMTLEHGLSKFWRNLRSVTFCERSRTRY